jgi:hypothetical protein
MRAIYAVRVVNSMAARFIGEDTALFGRFSVNRFWFVQHPHSLKTQHRLSVFYANKRLS